MTMQITDPSSARPVGPPPPFDPELVPVIEILTGPRSPDVPEPHCYAVSSRPVMRTSPGSPSDQG